jgi:mannose-6-phosphate isomerase-like protein (cupin superfamily)
MKPEWMSRDGKHFFCCEACGQTFLHPVPTSFSMKEALAEHAEEPLAKLYTDRHMQFVLENVAVGGDIARERHATQTQFIRIEKGSARINLFKEAEGGQPSESYTLTATRTNVVIVPENTYHQVVNTGIDVLHFSTIYSPRVH